jgi:Helix-turn-helix domain
MSSAIAAGPRNRWLDVEAVAARTPFEPVTIRRACQRGEIPGAVKRLGRWCIPVEAVDAWLAADPAEETIIDARDLADSRPAQPSFRSLMEMGK